MMHPEIQAEPCPPYSKALQSFPSGSQGRSVCGKARRQYDGQTMI